MELVFPWENQRSLLNAEMVMCFFRKSPWLENRWLMGIGLWESSGNLSYIANWKYGPFIDIAWYSERENMDHRFIDDLPLFHMAIFQFAKFFWHGDMSHPGLTLIIFYHLEQDLLRCLLGCWMLVFWLNHVVFREGFPDLPTKGSWVAGCLGEWLVCRQFIQLWCRTWRFIMGFLGYPIIKKQACCNQTKPCSGCMICRNSWVW